MHWEYGYQGAEEKVGRRVGPRLWGRRLAQRLIACGLLVWGCASQAGTWVPLTRTAPGAVNVMILLSDGTVMASNNDGFTIGGAWYRLTPDIHGSYINGTWTTLASMNDTRLYYASAVLRDGRLFVAGGEYGTGLAKSEVYDPLSNAWTPLPIPTTLLDPTKSTFFGGSQGFYDAPCEVLPNGNVIVAPVGPSTYGGTLIFNPTTSVWSAGPTLLHSGDQDEASWVKLPDNSLLTIDPFGVNSSRYIPSLNAWVNDATVPVALYDGVTFELGPGFLLPNGKAFFLGATGHTALYTPSGTTNPGSWAAGPDIPGGLATPDASGAMMPNGKILCAVSPKTYRDTLGNVVFPGPTSFYEYDYAANAFTAVNAPTGSVDFVAPFETSMLVLPDGNVLYSHFGSQVYAYQPGGSSVAAGKPAISSITSNPDGSYHLTGTQLNGISEGAAYGDDAQMSSNYPLVRLTDGAGNVYYARTFNWSSTGVMTGNTPVTTEFTLPANLPVGIYSLAAVANGISSDPVSFASPGVPNLTDISSSNGQYSFVLNGAAGSNYVVQVSPDFLNWSTLTTVLVPAGGAIVVSDTVDQGPHFYRALLQKGP